MTRFNVPDMSMNETLPAVAQRVCGRGPRAAARAAPAAGGLSSAEGRP